MHIFRILKKAVFDGHARKRLYEGSQELPLACFLTRLFSARPACAEKKSFAHSSEVVRSACLTLAAAASNPLLISRVTANFVLSAPRCCWLEPQRDSRGAGWLPETEALGGVTG